MVQAPDALIGPQSHVGAITCGSGNDRILIEQLRREVLHCDIEVMVVRVHVRSRACTFRVRAGFPARTLLQRFIV